MSQEIVHDKGICSVGVRTGIVFGVGQRSDIASLAEAKFTNIKGWAMRTLFVLTGMLIITSCGPTAAPTAIYTSPTYPPPTASPTQAAEVIVIPSLRDTLISEYGEILGAHLRLDPVRAREEVVFNIDNQLPDEFKVEVENVFYDVATYYHSNRPNTITLTIGALASGTAAEAHLRDDGTIQIIFLEVI